MFENKEITDWFIATHYGSKMTNVVYGSCCGIVVLENKAYSIKVFICSNG